MTENPFDHWDRIMAMPDGEATRRQVEADLSSGRLRMLDRSSAETCDEVESVPRSAPPRRCGEPAVLFDSVRDRNACVFHGETWVERRALGLSEYPLLEAS